ncbi:hypothetical protein T09_12865 [Trichinella sp. T9]|uniref:Uncharacterized protein n=1 Tax=Trichinella murrelli TaxID=144512 RepID=A0A0V0UFP9_9BILA|nr:hypothetical protein T05_8709 [Trichinella murrelli]KRX52804.1 hypothetical protein T09_12865 [Trichinella sp. T9]KRZ96489.1 hypothetical protein T08_7010 [Trichinella sp. T8]
MLLFKAENAYDEKTDIFRNCSVGSFNMEKSEHNNLADQILNSSANSADGAQKDKAPFRVDFSVQSKLPLCDPDVISTI